MKTLYLTRHAKSSWDDPGLHDFERPLNKRGKKNAPAMGQRLKEMGVLPDRIITSPAERAQSTTRLMAGEIGYPGKRIMEDRRIYNNSMADLLAVIRDVESAVDHLMIVGHNPSITELARYLSGIEVENIPTCGVFAIGFDLDTWTAIEEGTGKVRFFEYPKKQE